MMSAAQSEAYLRETDPKIDVAIREKDAGTLEAILAEDFIYNHSGGQSESRQSWIATIVSGKYPSRRDLSRIQVEFHDELAIVRGDLDIVAAEGKSAPFRYVRLYRFRSERWQAISHLTFPARDRVASV